MYLTYNINKCLICCFAALRIHVSPECKSILDELGGYHLEERGEVSMKVKQLKLTQRNIYYTEEKERFIRICIHYSLLAVVSVLLLVTLQCRTTHLNCVERCTIDVVDIYTDSKNVDE